MDKSANNIWNKLSHATDMRRCKYLWYYIVAILALLFSALVAEYMYLNSLYLVDEVYDSRIPKEITMDDQTTIR